MGYRCKWFKKNRNKLIYKVIVILGLTYSPTYSLERAWHKAKTKENMRKGK